MSKGLHDRISNIFLGDQGSDTLPLLSLTGMSGLTISSKYIASYTSLYPTSFLRQPEDALLNLTRLLRKLTSDFSQADSTWFHSEEAHFKLFVMATLPKVALLPQTYMRVTEPPRGMTPLLMVPCGRNPGAAALHCLARVFGNTLENDSRSETEQINPEDIWSRNESQNSDTSSTTDAPQPPYHDQVLSYALFATYLSYYPDLIPNLIAHVDAAASDEAMPALTLLYTLASSTWAPPPDENEPLSDQEFEREHEDYALYDECAEPTSPFLVPSAPQLRHILRTHRILPPSSPLPRIPCAPLDTPDDLTRKFDYGPRAFKYPILHLFEHPRSRAIFPWLLEPPQALENMVGSGLADPRGTVRRLTEAKWGLLGFGLQALRHGHPVHQEELGPTRAALHRVLLSATTGCRGCAVEDGTNDQGGRHLCRAGPHTCRPRYVLSAIQTACRAYAWENFRMSVLTYDARHTSQLWQSHALSMHLPYQVSQVSSHVGVCAA